MYKKVSVVYFSGTGGVKKIADAFVKELKNRSISVKLSAIDYSLLNQSDDFGDFKDDLLILIFPVHAFDAPIPVYEWLDRISSKNKSAAIISVSGGGEKWPNIGVRAHCYKQLVKKGFKVVYEKMMVMPSNWVFPTNDHLAMHLIKCIPQKVKNIVDELLSGKIKKGRYSKPGLLQIIVSKMEKRGTRKFGKEITIGNECTGCGWCAKNCPVNNIDMHDDKPVFREECIMCFRCVYGCSFRALKTKNFMVIKDGFSLDELEKRMKNVELEPIEKCAKGFLWAGAMDYIQDKDQ